MAKEMVKADDPERLSDGESNLPPERTDITRNNTDC